MSFIPEEKEERKWFYRIIFFGVLGLLVIGIFSLFFPILLVVSIFYIFNFGVYGIIFFVIGFFVGLTSNLDKDKLSKICFKGILCLEIIPIFFGFILVGIRGIFVILSILLMVLILFCAVICSLGSRLGTKLRRKRTVPMRETGR